MYHYNKTQFGGFLNILLFILAFLPITAAYLKIGSNPLPFSVAISISIILLITLLLFYKLTIKIDDEKISADFGIGLIKRTMHLKDIDIQTIEEVRVPWYYGIGLRLTPKGILYNVKHGNAIFMKSKNSVFFVGTHDFDTIKNKLIQLKNESK